MIQFCPKCGVEMSGPTRRSFWECTNDPKKCNLIQCRFDRKTRKPHNMKFRGIMPWIPHAEAKK